MYLASKGLTLVELMVVITIISLLASSIIYSTRQMRQQALVAQAKGEIQSIKTAMELFFTRHNDYPPLPRGSNFCNMCAYWPPSVPWTEGVWLDIATALQSNGFINGVETDPWGNPYLYDKNYRLGPYTCTTFSPICSMGPDGILQTPNCPPASGLVAQGDDICVALDR